MEFALNALVMGYRPLWGARRQLAGVQLFLHDVPDRTPDVAHLLHVLGEMWSPHSPRLLISPQSATLLRSLLAHATHRPQMALEVRGQWLVEDESLLNLVSLASAQGVALVWRGAINQLPAPAHAGYYTCSLLHLPREAMGPVALLDCQMYEGVHSQQLAHRCLEKHNAAALAGWPQADVLRQLRGVQALQPSYEHVLRLIRAVEADHPLDVFEDILSEDPLLAYRLLLYANSAGLGVRSAVDSLRRALVMLGYGPLKSWLASQIRYASNEPDLQPIRQSMVMRAQLISHLLDAGISEELRSEVYLCGLFSRIADILQEPPETSLGRLPLSGRIFDAVVNADGPYAASLQMAIAQEQEDGGSTIRSLCIEHAMEHEYVNRTLLRLVTSWRSGHSTW